ncbi:MAG: metallopeptidase family protein [Phycisphaerales bacterium]|jgi:predicted Zn-dependent protease with MMP-like domain|nr:metallopeptidase family protein [Phycisphaerales bacterium]
MTDDAPSPDASPDLPPALRARFDRLLASVLRDLPPQAREALQVIPVIVEDELSETMRADLLREGVLEDLDDEILGLHTGRMITEGPAESLELPTQIHLFRGPIIDAAADTHDTDNPSDDAIAEEIRITLLHELGHHFGLDEDDLDRLGFG